MLNEVMVGWLSVGLLRSNWARELAFMSELRATGLVKSYSLRVNWSTRVHDHFTWSGKLLTWM